MKKALKDAWSAVATRLGTMTVAGGYWHDVLGVLPRLELTGQTARRPGMLYLPVEDSGEYNDPDEYTMSHDFIQPVYAIAQPSKGETFTTASGADLLDWHDDIVKCLSGSDWWLSYPSSGIQCVVPIEKSLYSEPIREFPAHLRIAFRLTIAMNMASLGPDGV